MAGLSSIEGWARTSGVEKGRAVHSESRRVQLACRESAQRYVVQRQRRGVPRSDESVRRHRRARVDAGPRQSACTWHIQHAHGLGFEWSNWKFPAKAHEFAEKENLCSDPRLDLRNNFGKITRALRGSERV